MKTLEELENVAWLKPQFESGLSTRCHELRKVPIDELSPEDLRVLIGQGIGLEHLLPLALAVLEEDPLAEGDLYPGDLLAAVIGLHSEAWQANPTSWEAARRVGVEAHAMLLSEVGQALLPEPLRGDLIAEVVRFNGAPPPNNSLRARRP